MAKKTHRIEMIYKRTATVEIDAQPKFVEDLVWQMEEGDSLNGNSWSLGDLVGLDDTWTLQSVEVK